MSFFSAGFESRDLPNFPMRFPCPLESEVTTDEFQLMSESLGATANDTRDGGGQGDTGMSVNQVVKISGMFFWSKSDGH